MDDRYELTFEDARGREATTIHNDGGTLRLSLRAVDFEGSDFDCLSPVSAHLERARTLFTLQQDSLCACRLAWIMPLGLEREGRAFAGSLAATLVLGQPLPNGAIDEEVLTLALETGEGVVRSSGRSGWFEDELLEIARAVAPATRLRSCLTCAFSDYSPLGHGLFGGLACFRDEKAAYAAVKDKTDLFELWTRLTAYVQETYVCGAFEPRRPGTGYRG